MPDARAHTAQRGQLQVIVMDYLQAKAFLDGHDADGDGHSVLASVLPGQVVASTLEMLRANRRSEYFAQVLRAQPAL